MSSVTIPTSFRSEANLEEHNTIKDLEIEEREEVFIDIARALENAARDAFIEGHRHFAAMSTNMAEAIRINADQLARDDLRHSERVLARAGKRPAARSGRVKTVTSRQRSPPGFERWRPESLRSDESSLALSLWVIRRSTTASRSISLWGRSPPDTAEPRR